MVTLVIVIVLGQSWNLCSHCISNSFSAVSADSSREPESQTRPRAGTARFSCQAEGTPVPRITWFKNGQVIHSNGRTKMYNKYVQTNTSSKPLQNVIICIILTYVPSLCASKLVITQIIPEDDCLLPVPSGELSRFGCVHIPSHRGAFGGPSQRTA